MNKLYVIGIGPGAEDQMTRKALDILRDVDVIAGYGVYVELVKPLFPDKEYLVTPMRKEVDRCRMALDAAKEGRSVAMISSGLPGILAGIMLSLAVLALGKGTMEKALLRTDLPGPMRKLVPKRAFATRMENVSSAVKRNLYKSFENEKNEEITTRMVDETSAQIELCLTKMAEIVEIPLG